MIRILTHPVAVRVSYSAVTALVPTLWSGIPKIDFMVHIGMAGGRQFYSLERRGHRDGYLSKDVDGKLLGEDEGDGHGTWKREGLPEEIETDVDLDDVWRRWKQALPVSFPGHMTAVECGRFHMLMIMTLNSTWTSDLRKMRDDIFATLSIIQVLRTYGRRMKSGGWYSFMCRSTAMTKACSKVKR